MICQVSMLPTQFIDKNKTLSNIYTIMGKLEIGTNWQCHNMSYHYTNDSFPHSLSVDYKKSDRNWLMSDHNQNALSL